MTRTRPSNLKTVLIGTIAIVILTALVLDSPVGRAAEADRPARQVDNPLTCLAASNRPGEGILLAWHVQSDVAIDGMRLWRAQFNSDNVRGPFVPAEELPLPPAAPTQEPNGDGIRFMTVDPNVAEGVRYAYQIVITETAPFSATHQAEVTWRYNSGEDAPQDEEICSQERTSATWTPTPTPLTPTSTPTWTLIPTHTPTPTRTHTPTWTPTPTMTPTPTATPTPLPGPTNTPYPTPTPTATFTFTPIPPTPTMTPTPTITPTSTPVIAPPGNNAESSDSPSPTPTDTPPEPTAPSTDTPLPTATGAPAPTATPTATPLPLRETPTPPEAERAPAGEPDATPSAEAAIAGLGPVPARESAPSDTAPAAVEERDRIVVDDYAPRSLPRDRTRLLRFGLYAVAVLASMAAVGFLLGVLALLRPNRGG